MRSRLALYFVWSLKTTSPFHIPWFEVATDVDYAFSYASMLAYARLLFLIELHAAHSNARTGTDKPMVCTCSLQVSRRCCASSPKPARPRHGVSANRPLRLQGKPSLVPLECKLLLVVDYGPPMARLLCLHYIALLQDGDEETELVPHLCVALDLYQHGEMRWFEHVDRSSSLDLNSPSTTRHHCHESYAVHH